jgi:hypothetical protein
MTAALDKTSHSSGASDNESAPGPGDWLSLAAAPTFAVMALLSAVHAGGSFDTFCSTAHGGLHLTGMTSMYLLMSAFHSAPWLRLLSSRRTAPGWPRRHR